jgi:hypothetical protein
LLEANVGLEDLGESEVGGRNRREVQTLKEKKSKDKTVDVVNVRMLSIIRLIEY